MLYTIVYQKFAGGGEFIIRKPEIESQREEGEKIEISAQVSMRIIMEGCTQAFTGGMDMFRKAFAKAIRDHVVDFPVKARATYHTAFTQVSHADPIVRGKRSVCGFQILEDSQMLPHPDGCSSLKS